MRVVSLCLFVAALSLSHGDSPITRVVVLIEGLKSKIIADGSLLRTVLRLHLREGAVFF